MTRINGGRPIKSGTSLEDIRKKTIKLFFPNLRHTTSLHQSALVTNILPLLQRRAFLIMLLPEALSILSKNLIFIALYNVVATYFILA